MKTIDEKNLIKNQKDLDKFLLTFKEETFGIIHLKEEDNKILNETNFINIEVDKS